jgi:hypothetical protein
MYKTVTIQIVVEDTGMTHEQLCEGILQQGLKHFPYRYAVILKDVMNSLRTEIEMFEETN